MVSRAERPRGIPMPVFIGELGEQAVAQPSKSGVVDRAHVCWRIQTRNRAGRLFVDGRADRADGGERLDAMRRRDIDVDDADVVRSRRCQNRRARQKRNYEQTKYLKMHTHERVIRARSTFRPAATCAEYAARYSREE